MRQTLIAFCLGLSLTGAALAEPRRFDTPEAAAEAFRGAVEAGGVGGMLAVFGTEALDLLLDDDDARQQRNRRRLLASWRRASAIEPSADGATATLLLGHDEWPFPIPLARDVEGQWYFDTEAGREAVLARIIGHNELDVLDLLRAYVEVQAGYRATDWDGDGVMEFAAHIISTGGQRDGLYWPREPGAPRSPVGDRMARAAAEGYMLDGALEAPEPLYGYVFHVLQFQGPDAPGGAMAYVVGGNMVAGHALIAYPAEYGITGEMTFMVSEAGTIVERDFGPETLAIAGAIEVYDPGEGWTIVP